jgi:hypothetical protein
LFFFPFARGLFFFMWPTTLAVLRAAGVRFMQRIGASGRGTRHVFVDVSAALRAAPDLVTTAACIETLIRVPLAEWQATVGVAAFDTTPLLPLDLPDSKRARTFETGLAHNSMPDVALLSAAALDDAAALDGSVLLQWQWQSAALLPALRADVAARPAAWPSGGLTLDRVVQRRASTRGPPTDMDFLYRMLAHEALGRYNEMSIEELMVELRGDYSPVVLRGLAHSLAVNDHYQCVHLSNSATAPRNAGAAEPAPAESFCKILQAVERLARRPELGDVVIVSARPDAFLFLLSYLGTKATALPLGWLWLVLPGDVAVDAVAAAEQLTQYSARMGLGSRDALVFFLTLAGGSEVFGRALWATLPTLGARPVLPRGPDFRPSTAPVGALFDDARVAELCAADARALACGWLRDAYLMLLEATDMVHLRERLQRLPALRALVPVPAAWAQQVRYVRYRLRVYMPRAWAASPLDFFDPSRADVEAERGLCTVVLTDNMARVLRDPLLFQRRLVLERDTYTKKIRLRYVASAKE